MNVLKSGKDANWGVELRCEGSGTGMSGGCGAVLLVAPRDVKSRTYSCYGDMETCYYFVCPECGVKTAVDTREFSPRTMDA